MIDMKNGYSIIELLIVVAVFSVIGILVTQALTLSIKSVKKGDSIVLVKQEIDYASESVERILQSANAVISSCGVTGTTSATITLDSIAGRIDLSCYDFGSGDLGVAVSYGNTVLYSNRFTSNRISITNCSFTCFSENQQTYVDFSITANAKNVTSDEGANVTTSRKVIIRSGSKK